MRYIPDADDGEGPPVMPLEALRAMFNNIERQMQDLEEQVLQFRGRQAMLLVAPATVPTLVSH